MMYHITGTQGIDIHSAGHPIAGGITAIPPYCMLACRHDEVVDWAVNQVNWLARNDRMGAAREQVHAGFYHHRWEVLRDTDGVPKELALDHPYQGCVMVMVDRAEDVEQARFDHWLRGEHLPGVLADSPAAMCLGLEPEPLPDDAPSYVRRPPGLERRTLHLYFLECDPRDCWQDVFAPQERAIADSGLGAVSFTAAFIPTIPRVTFSGCRASSLRRRRGWSQRRTLCHREWHPGS